MIRRAALAHGSSPERGVVDRRTEELALRVESRSPEIPANADVSGNRVSAERPIRANEPAEIQESKSRAIRVAPPLQADGRQSTVLVDCEIDRVLGLAKCRHCVTLAPGGPPHV